MQAVEGAAADVTGVDDLKAIRESESKGSMELITRGSASLLAISSLGGTIRHASFGSGTGRIIVGLPPDGDIRRIADAIGRDYSMEFITKEKQERSVTAAHEFRDALHDALTERQQTALQTAYFMDYFESPRGSTTEETATSLDITGSTLLYHPRAG